MAAAPRWATYNWERAPCQDHLQPQARCTAKYPSVMLQCTWNTRINSSGYFLTSP